MIHYLVETTNPNVNQASNEVSQFFTQLKSDDLTKMARFSFTHTNDTHLAVLAKIKIACLAHQIYTIKEYKPWNWKFSKVIGHAQGKTIYVNKYMLNTLDVADLTENIAHETMHLLGYTHDGNRVTPYNLNTVPYVIGSLARAWYWGNKQ